MNPRPLPPGTNELLALARKYRTLAALRRARACGGPVAPRTVLRALAHEFPGALRELETATLDDLDARAARLEAVARDGEPAASWMTLVCDYHAWMRIALDVKLRLRTLRALNSEHADSVAREMTARAAREVDAAFVVQVASPPGGRVRGVVIVRLAAIHGMTEEAVRAVVLPPALSSLRDPQ